MLLHFFFAKVKVFRFWPKTMDYANFFLHIYLLTLRCYRAELCSFMLLLRCPFIQVTFLRKVKIFHFCPKNVDYRGLSEIEVIVCSPFTHYWKVL